MPIQSEGPPNSPIRIFAMTGENTHGESRRAERAFALAGYPDARVTARRTFRIQGVDDPEILKRLLVNPAAGETLTEFTPGVGIEVAYQPSVFDPETHTGLDVAERLGVNIDWLRLGWLYEVDGIDQATAKQVIRNGTLQ